MTWFMWNVTASTLILSHSNPVAFHCAGWINVPIVVCPKRYTIQSPAGASHSVLPVRSITCSFATTPVAGNASTAMSR